jgi:DNA-binding NtrC family response regulator
LERYLPEIAKSNLPALINQEKASGDFTEREILYKLLFEMRQDISDLKAVVFEMMDTNGSERKMSSNHPAAIKRLYDDYETEANGTQIVPVKRPAPYDIQSRERDNYIDEHEEVEESLSIEDTERELIQKALKKYNNRRKNAAKELGISERTLYRKIKEYNLK